MELSTINRFRRAMLSIALAERGQAEIYAANKFSWDLRTKAAVSALTSADFSNEVSEDQVYLREVLKTSIIGPMLPFMLEVGFREPFNNSAVVSANWIAEFNPAPLSKASLDTDSLDRRKVVSLGVFSKEALRQASGQEQIGRAHETEVRATIDRQFIDPAAVGFAGESPRSVTADAEPIVATADPKASVRALLKDFSNQNTSFLITDPETAAQANLTDSVFADVGVRGGSIAGIPVICSQSSPRDSSGGQIVLLDASRIVIALGGMEVLADSEGMIEMDNEFDSNGDGELVSMFQTESVALKTVSFANWKLAEAGACRILTGCDW